MADSVIFEKSMTTDIDENPFTHRDWVVANDQNSKSYGSGQIVISTETIANSGKLVDYSQGVLMFPVCCVVTASGNFRDAANPGNISAVDMSAVTAQLIQAIKSGHHHLIHSMSIQYNNGDVTQLSAYQNIYASYKLNTSMSLDDVQTVGSTIGFCPDSSDSWAFAGANSILGRGSCNNTNFSNGTFSNAGVGSNQLSNGNRGMIQRQEWLNTPAGSTNDYASYGANALAPLDTLAKQYTGVIKTNPGVTAVAYAAAVNAVTAVNGVANEGDNTYVAPVAAANAIPEVRAVAGSVSGQVLQFTATIRLKDLATDFFEKLPLTRGATFKFMINVNNSSFTITKHAGNTATNTTSTKLVDVDSPTLILSNASALGTNPLMIASSYGYTTTVGVTTTPGKAVKPLPTLGANYAPVGAVTAVNRTLGAGLASIPCDKSDVTFVCSYNVGDVVYGTHTQLLPGLPGLTTAPTLPCRLVAPIYTLNPLRMNEYMSQGQKKFTYTDIFSYQLLNKAPNSDVQQIITNGIAGLKKVIMVPFISAADNGGVSPLISPFASEPATTSPLIGQFTNVNIRYGGVNLLQANVRYGYEAFLQNVYGINSINGGLTTGFNSGLISKDMWENNYQYYVFDVSRRLKEEDRVSKAVEVIFFNNNLVAVDVFVFLEFEREMVIDLATGARIQ